MVRLRTFLLTAILLLLCARVVRAQEIGTVAGVDGSAEIGHNGTWSTATVGAALYENDALRTGRPGRLRVVFEDDTVLNIGEGTELVIDKHVFDPARGIFRTVLRLLAGKMRSLVGADYQRPGAVYEVDTASAVVGVRGTEFVISFDPTAEVTDVVGVTGQVAVHSVIDLTGQGVVVTAQELTTVARGQLPTPPQRLTDTVFRQYLDGLEFIGSGRPESLTVGNPLLSGNAVRDADQAAAVPAPQAAAFPGPYVPPWDSMNDHDANGVAGQPIDFINTPGGLGVTF